MIEPDANNAEFIKHLATSGATIVGVEILPNQVAIANQHLVDFRKVLEIISKYMLKTNPNQSKN
ncbi:MAG: hypothetical protein HWQ36_18670 [Nostoc sp. NMS2]|uniref:hypothetical protein n=1 Tax=Nostoc sp. NMS2 TaxID=2815389 RepID=UPI0025E8449C|nr:hypothetical protein [Nostoc sp. NMS2]MBN3992488.1 hypothetical protein [Nostoc sp. NMS2]